MASKVARDTHGASDARWARALRLGEDKTCFVHVFDGGRQLAIPAPFCSRRSHFRCFIQAWRGLGALNDAVL